jgi:4-amino-4-deoxy-L-arabinose transferase-like glycosyltransferase
MTRAIRPSWRASAIETALVVFVTIVAVLVLRGPMAAQRFTIDESRWISTSRYFWITLIRQDVFGPEWRPNYIVLTHPPVARYIIGFGLWLQDWKPEQLNGRYDSLQSPAYNQRAGNIPSANLLAAARRVTFPFGVGAMVLIYVVGRMLAGRLAGLAAITLALSNPLLTTIWTRALAESILAFFTLAALALALRTLPRLACGQPKPWLPMAVGISLALAAATKISGGIAAAGLGAFALIQQALALARTRRTAGLRGWIDLVLAAVMVFIAVNPLLYPSPIGRTLTLIQQRQEEMEFQQDVFDRQAVPDGLVAHGARVGFRTFVTYATPRGPLPVSPDVILAPAGLAVLLVWAALGLRRGRTNAALLFVLWAAGLYAVITANLGFDSPHYYAPLVTANVIGGGVAIGLTARGLGRKIGRRWSRRASSQKTQIPAM